MKKERRTGATESSNEQENKSFVELSRRDFLKTTGTVAAGAAVAPALAGCGDAIDETAGSAAEPEPITTGLSEVAQAAEAFATTATDATASVEATSTTVSNEAHTPIASEASSSAAAASGEEVSVAVSQPPSKSSTKQQIAERPAPRSRFENVIVTLRV